VNSVLTYLEEAVGKHLVQREPYPVVAPPNAQVVSRVIEAAQRSDHKILVIGTGTSFGDRFSLLRVNVIAVTMSGFTGITINDEFSSTAAAGTVVSEVVKQLDGYEGRTLGGLLARQIRSADRELQRYVWQRISLLEVVDGTGRQRVLPGPAKTNSLTSAGADFMIGSCGRYCVITGAQFSQPLPIDVPAHDGMSILGAASAGRAPIAREEILPLLDPNAIFKW
jgi:FAD/FMN-containing dehydrogenase